MTYRIDCISGRRCTQIDLIYSVVKIMNVGSLIRFQRIT